VIDIERVAAGRRESVERYIETDDCRSGSRNELDEQGAVEILINSSYNRWLLDCRSERATQMLGTILKALF
jgi:hypothetical protein